MNTRNEPALSATWTATTAVIGAVLLLAGLLWPHAPSGLQGAAWSETQARQYARASAAYHRAQSSDATDSRTQAELAKARAEFEQVRRELDEAIERPRRIALWMKLAGGGLLVVSGALALRQRSDD